MNFLIDGLATLLISLSVDDPKLLKDFVEPEVGYAHSALPFESALTRAEFDAWIALLDATPAQAAAIQARHDAFIVEQYNPLVERTAAEYLVKSATASRALQSQGMASDEFRTAWKSVDQRARALIATALQLELQFIAAMESIEPVLTIEQVDSLEVLRDMASRRAAHAVPSTSQWVNFELRQVWGAPTLPRQPEPDRAIIRDQLAQYEHELTALLEQWSRARLDATRKMQRHCFDAARGALEESDADPAQIWARSANLTKRLRVSHLTAHEQLLALVSGGCAQHMRATVSARLYPNLYPDSAYDIAMATMTAAIASASGSMELEGRLTAVRDEFELRYRELSKQLERACDDWDDEVASGVGSATPQGLSAALAPYREERDKLCQEFAARCADLLVANASSP